MHYLPTYESRWFAPQVVLAPYTSRESTRMEGLMFFSERKEGVKGRLVGGNGSETERERRRQRKGKCMCNCACVSKVFSSVGANCPLSQTEPQWRFGELSGTDGDYTLLRFLLFPHLKGFCECARHAASHLLCLHTPTHVRGEARTCTCMRVNIRQTPGGLT